MKFPSADRYNEAVQNPSVYFTDPEVKRRQVQTDALGLPEVLSGGFAFTYRFRGAGDDIAVRCFHREIPELFERYRAISSFLSAVQSKFFVDFSFSERGIRIDGTDLPVVRMRWIEGETLLGYVSRRRSDPAALDQLRDQLLLFAEEADRRGFAHGDVQHRNLMVTPDGSLKLVDYDGMYVPAIKHLKAADGGHPHFQPPSRSMHDFGPRMDRFPLAVIDFSLEALKELPRLFDQFHRGENLILARDDFVNPSTSPVLNAIARVPRMASRVAAFSDVCRLSAREAPALREFRAGAVGGASVVAPTPSAPRPQIYTSPFDVVDGMDYRSAVRCVGRPVELIGQVLQVKSVPEKGLVLLRFGTRYSATPTVVVPLALFSQWNHSAKMGGRPWITATGVLQTHRSGQYSSVQVLVKEASDIELLANKEEAEFRLGRITRDAPKPPAPPKPTPTNTPATAQSGTPMAALPTANGKSSNATPVEPWKKARGTGSGDPGWITAGVASGASPGTSTPNAKTAPAPTGSVGTAPSGTSFPSQPLTCPRCRREAKMPVGRSYLKCPSCGIGSEAKQWILPPAAIAALPRDQSPRPIQPLTASSPTVNAPTESDRASARPWLPLAVAAAVIFVLWLLAKG